MPQPEAFPSAEPLVSYRDAIFRHAQRLITLAQTPRSDVLDADGFTEEERAGGDLLDALAMELRPALRDAASTVSVGDAPTRFVLTGDGRFLRLEAGSAWPIRRTAVLMRVEADIRAVLDDLEVGLVQANRPMATAAAILVREVRDLIEAGLGRAVDSNA